MEEVGADVGADVVAKVAAGRPDPAAAGSLDELAALLRRLKVGSGDPSYTEITRRINDCWTAAGRPPGELTRRSTVAGYFSMGRSRPDEELTVAIVRALQADPDYAERWRGALRTIRGEIAATAYANTRQGLPADPAGFIGRAAELAVLDGVAGGAVIVTGMAGIGKTRLALHAAHRLTGRGRFGDLQLFVDLRGFHPAGPPADPAAILAGLLRQLGLPGEQIPLTLAGRAELLGGLLRGRRTLIVLDNAGPGARLAPVVPDVPGCLTLITSRQVVTGVPGAVHIALDVLSPEESLRLLGTVAGNDRIAADPGTAGTIARLLGHLPLAVSVIGGHLRDHPEWTLADYLEPLTSLALDGGVAAALTLSERDLPEPLRLTVKLVAIQPGPSITAEATAALTGQGIGTARAQLDALACAGLLQRAADARYGMHDLVRAWAAGRARLELPDSRTRPALTRLLDHYRDVAARAMDVAYPHEKGRRPRIEPAAPVVPAIDTPVQAVAWLDAETATMVSAVEYAARRGWAAHAINLTTTVWRHLDLTGQYAAGVIMCGEALNAARLRADRTAELAVLMCAGNLRMRQGDYDTALDLLRRAWSLACVEHDRLSESRATTNIGVVLLQQNRYAEALEQFERALAINRELGDLLGISRSLGNIGAIYYWQGRYRDALDVYRQDYEATCASGDRPGEGTSLYNVALVYNRLGRHREALDCVARAEAIQRDCGDRVGEGLALDETGVAHQGLGAHETALDYHRRAADMHGAVSYRAGEGVALINLGDAYLALGRYPEALEHHRRALDIHRCIGETAQEVVALNSLGAALRATGQLAEAADAYTTALAGAEKTGDRYELARAHAGLGDVRRAEGDPAGARRHWGTALDLYTDLGVPQARRMLALLNG